MIGDVLYVGEEVARTDRRTMTPGHGAIAVTGDQQRELWRQRQVALRRVEDCGQPDDSRDSVPPGGAVCAASPSRPKPT